MKINKYLASFDMNFSVCCHLIKSDLMRLEGGAISCFLICGMNHLK